MSSRFVPIRSATLKISNRINNETINILELSLSKGYRFFHKSRYKIRVIVCRHLNNCKSKIRKHFDTLHSANQMTIKKRSDINSSPLICMISLDWTIFSYRQVHLDSFTKTEGDSRIQTTMKWRTNDAIIILVSQNWFCTRSDTWGCSAEKVGYFVEFSAFVLGYHWIADYNWRRNLNSCDWTTTRRPVHSWYVRIWGDDQINQSDIAFPRIRLLWARDHATKTSMINSILQFTLIIF